MTKKKNKKEYQAPRIRDFVSFIAEQYGLDPKEMGARLIHNFPELKNKEVCANCGGSMVVYFYTLDVLDALLLFGMGKIVDERCKQGMTFTDANKIHLQTKLNTYYSVPSRSTQCSKLGLVAKVMTKDKTHDRKAGWCITKRGFEFLAGKPVPKHVKVFQNEIKERFDIMTTFGEVMHSGDSKGSIEFNNYQKYNFSKLETWAVAGFAQGKLL